MIKYTIFCLSLCVGTAGLAQTLSPNVLPATGNYFSAGGASLSWTLGETATLTLQSGSAMLTQGEQQPEIINPLPLTWLAVDGDLNTQKQAVIAWKVDEQQVAGFTVEKQTASGIYTAIGNTTSLGNGQHTYSFTEATPLNGVATYRVKQIDINNNFTYSRVIVLKNSSTGRVWVYPNPAGNNTSLYVTDASLINKPVKLIDMQGRVLQQWVVQSLTFIDLSGYAQGLYMLQFQNGDQLQLIKCK